MRVRIKEHHRIIYYNYLTAGTINRNLAEVDERANEMFIRLVQELSEKENITEKLNMVAGAKTFPPFLFSASSGFYTYVRRKL